MQTSLSAVIITAAVPIAVFGAESAAVKNLPAPPPAPLLNQSLRAQSESWNDWDIGGQVRTRLEHKRYFATPGQPGAVDFLATGNSDNTYLLLREKFHVGYTPTTWLQVYGETRDSSSHGDERNPNPEADTFDLHQGFLRIGDPQAFPVTLKVGRQELSQGDERLVGAFDWNNIGRVFDAAKLAFENEHLNLEAFAGRVIIPDDDNFNVANDYEWFSGFHATLKTLCPKQTTQFYFLARNASVDSPTALGSGLPPFMAGASPRDIYTVGLRLKSLPGAFGPWDYSFEAARQFGRFRFGVDPVLTPSLDHDALAIHAGGGYAWKETWGAPRVGLEYNFATGDDNPTDGDHGTFENLYPTNHKFYGYMDFASWQNLHNPRLTLSLKPAKTLTATFDLHGFWLADTSDFFYQVNGAPRASGGYGIAPAASSYVGSEIDFILTYTPKPYLALQAGFGHFFAGGYISDSLAASGGDQDADYVYLQASFTF